MNILIIGKPFDDIVCLVKASKYTEKIYTALNKGDTEFPNIEYRNFDELIQKSIALKIDIAINLEKDLIQKGIAEAFEQSKINLISVNQKWFNLEQSRLSAKKLLNHYKINIPKIIQIPLTFPVKLKTDLPGTEYRINSMNELVSQMEKFKNQTIFFEEYIEGKPLELYALWDKENIKYFYDTKTMTEVQIDRLDLLKTKLNFMFSDEKADFTGIFAINLIWYKNDWYVDGFDMGAFLPKELCKTEDFIYVLNSVIYQKLNEI